MLRFIFTLDEELFTPDNPKARDFVGEESVDDLPSMREVEAVEVNDEREEICRSTAHSSAAPNWCCKMS